MVPLKLSFKFCRGGKNPPPKNRNLLCLLQDTNGNVRIAFCAYILHPTEVNPEGYVWVENNSIGMETVIPFAWLDTKEIEESLGTLSGQEFLDTLKKLGFRDFQLLL